MEDPAVWGCSSPGLESFSELGTRWRTPFPPAGPPTLCLISSGVTLGQTTLTISAIWPLTQFPANILLPAADRIIRYVFPSMIELCCQMQITHSCTSNSSQYRTSTLGTLHPSPKNYWPLFALNKVVQSHWSWSWGHLSDVLRAIWTMSLSNSVPLTLLDWLPTIPEKKGKPTFKILLFWLYPFFILSCHSLCFHLSLSPPCLLASSSLLAMHSLLFSLPALDSSRCLWLFSLSYLQ